MSDWLVDALLALVVCSVLMRLFTKNNTITNTVTTTERSYKFVEQPSGELGVAVC